MVSRFSEDSPSSENRDNNYISAILGIIDLLSTQKEHRRYFLPDTVFRLVFRFFKGTIRYVDPNLLIDNIKKIIISCQQNQEVSQRRRHHQKRVSRRTRRKISVYLFIGKVSAERQRRRQQLLLLCRELSVARRYHHLHIAELQVGRDPLPSIL